MTPELETKINKAPDWFTQVRNDYQDGVSHAFLLHFNVNDYAGVGLPRCKNYLAQVLSSRLCVFYNISQGIHFPNAAAERIFRDRMMGETATTPDPLAALGLGDTQNELDLPTAPAAAFAMLEKFMKMPSDGENDKPLVIIDYPEAVIPQATGPMAPEDRLSLVNLSRWGVDAEIGEAGSIVIILADTLSELHTKITAASSRWDVIEIPLPNYDDRLTYCEAYLSASELESEYSIESVAFATAFLNYTHIEDIFLRSAAGGIVTQEIVTERVREIAATEYADVLEIVDPRIGFDQFGGLQYVKDYLSKSVVRPMQAGRTDRVPMGILFTGPAGTGKTIMAEALAGECGIMMVKLNPAQLYGQYVGNTERNLEKALRAIEGFGQVIVFIDEIDQVTGRGGGGDSGVSSRVFRRLLEFMSDGAHRGRVVFIAATNRVDLMDAALKRPGRFDKQIPFLIPDGTDRELILEVMLNKYSLDIAGFDRKNLELFQTLTEGWTGAEIEGAVIKAVEISEDENLTVPQAIAQAVVRVIPNTQDIEFMTLIALNEITDTDLVPPRYRDKLMNKKDLQAQIEAAAPTQRKAGRSL